MVIGRIDIEGGDGDDDIGGGYRFGCESVGIIGLCLEEGDHHVP
jgi:hypothetical protein